MHLEKQFSEVGGGGGKIKIKLDPSKYLALPFILLVGTVSRFHFVFTIVSQSKFISCSNLLLERFCVSGSNYGQKSSE